MHYYRHAKPMQLDYIVRPKNAYMGGNYGDYGGYDIILLKLKASIKSTLGPGHDAICLPKDETYNDVGAATIAGYGRYRRAPCEVNRHGPEKYEYCGTEKACVKGHPVTKFAIIHHLILYLNHKVVSYQRELLC